MHLAARSDQFRFGAKQRRRLDPDRVATTLELTGAEAQVAVWMTEGKNVRDIAEATGQSPGAIYWRLKQIYRKQSLSRQADLVRLVLSLAELGYGGGSDHDALDLVERARLPPRSGS